MNNESLSISDTLLNDIESNQLKIDLKVKEQNVTEMVNFIYSKFHKRERKYINEINSFINENHVDVPHDLEAEVWLDDWNDFAQCHLKRFTQEEQVLFSELLKCEAPLIKGGATLAMHMGTLSRPFFDLESEHNTAIVKLKELKSTLLERSLEFPKLESISDQIELFYKSVIEHIHYETFVLYPSVLELEATLCH